MKLYLLIPILILSGCATLQQKYVGAEVTTILDSYGIPNSRMEYDDGELWEYIDRCNSGAVVMPGYGGYPIAFSNNRCRHTTFRIRNGFIVEANEKTR